MSTTIRCFTRRKARPKKNRTFINEQRILNMLSTTEERSIKDLMNGFKEIRIEISNSMLDYLLRTMKDRGLISVSYFQKKTKRKCNHFLLTQEGSDLRDKLNQEHPEYIPQARSVEASSGEIYSPALLLMVPLR